jgi:hypothetical protein
MPWKFNFYCRGLKYFLENTFPKKDKIICYMWFDSVIYGLSSIK